MKKHFLYHKKKKRTRPFFSFLMLILGIVIVFNLLDNTNVEITDKELVKFLLRESNIITTKNSEMKKLKKIINHLYNHPEKILTTTKSKLIDLNKQTQPTIIATETTKNNPPLIYIYNTHQTEEYMPSSFLEYTVNPTVMIANYILEERFNNNNYPTIVEESSIKEILNRNNWKYNNSYKASRLLLEKAKKENPTLKYYIDVHRDSLKKEKTTVEINGKPYAKTIFLIGTENSHYQKNLEFTTRINTLLNEKYPNLSKGIYKKGGIGVNGIYNQDFSEYAILIEIGGYENTTTEVMNSALAFAECYTEVISKYENPKVN